MSFEKPNIQLRRPELDIQHTIYFHVPVSCPWLKRVKQKEKVNVDDCGVQKYLC